MERILEDTRLAGAVCYRRMFRQEHETFVAMFLCIVCKQSVTDTEHNSSQTLQNAVEQPAY